MKLLQKNIVNTFKFSLTCMEGDADGFKTESLFVPKFQGTYLEEVTQVLVTQIKKARRGLSGRDSQKLKEKTSQLLGALQHFQEEAKNAGTTYGPVSGEDCASEFMAELGYGHYGPGDDIRDPYELQLSYFDAAGDEYLVFKVDDQGKTDY